MMWLLMLKAEVDDDSCDCFVQHLGTKFHDFSGIK